MLADKLNVSMPGMVSIPPHLWPQFQQLVQRGANLWPDAPPEIKEFADKVTVGQVLQDYFAQANVPKPLPQTNPFKGASVMSHAEQTTQAINTERQNPPPAMHFSFAADIVKFNEMYKMPNHFYDGQNEMAARLKQFKKMILDELTELDDIIDKLEGAGTVEGQGTVATYPTKLPMLTDLADLLGDLQVFCASEMRRFSIPIDATLSIIMQSNFSKLQADGTALFIDGKLQKGPNYWKPEPKIEQMLIEYDNLLMAP
jgi:hypothetical protein